MQKPLENNDYCFTAFDVCQFGNNNESGVLVNSTMGMLLDSDSNSLKIRICRIINERVGALPYYLVGDEIASQVVKNIYNHSLIICRSCVISV